MKASNQFSVGVLSTCAIW